MTKKPAQMAKSTVITVRHELVDAYLSVSASKHPASEESPVRPAPDLRRMALRARIMPPTPVGARWTGLQVAGSACVEGSRASALPVGGGIAIGNGRALPWAEGSAPQLVGEGWAVALVAEDAAGAAGAHPLAQALAPHGGGGGSGQLPLMHRCRR